MVQRTVPLFYVKRIYLQGVYYNCFILTDNSFHLLLSAIISLVGIIMAIEWQEEKRCEAYFIMLYLRAFFWLITFVS